MPNTNTKLKEILICADDYAFCPNNSQSIRELIQNKKINATSCMSDTKYWPQEAEKLKELLKKIPKENQPLIGLHFSLTEPTISSNYIKSLVSSKNTSLLELLIRSKLKILSKKKISKILEYQLNNFIKHFGRYPDFIDGHQHVHQFPIIRSVLIKFHKKRNIETPFFIRSTYPLYGSLDKFKEFIINLSGAKKFRKLLKKNNILTNNGFAGLYKESVKYKSNKTISEAYFNFLENINNLGLIMCHPGRLTDNTSKETDPIYQRRVLEHNYFKSNKFISDLKKTNTTICSGKKWLANLLKYLE
jgi:chitin disaccharide deacetylase